MDFLLFAGTVMSLMFLGFFLYRQNAQDQTIKGVLSPCPKTPNYVASVEPFSSHYLPPLSCCPNDMQKLLQIVQTFPRVKVITVTDTYIHIECRSRLFGFVDDLEFLKNESMQLIDFRSCARAGYWDFGVNKKRMEKICKEYAVL